MPAGAFAGRFISDNGKAKAKAELTSLELRPDHVGARAALARIH
jgi:hypothetical protein